MSRRVVVACAAAAIALFGIQPALAAVKPRAASPTPAQQAATSTKANPFGNAPTLCAPAPCNGDTTSAGLPGVHAVLAHAGAVRFRLSPHVVRPGDSITATVVPAADPCAGQQPCATGWDWPVIGGVTPACATGPPSGQAGAPPDLTCVYRGIKAADPGRPGWQVATLNLHVPASVAATTEDFYAVSAAGTAVIEGHIADGTAAGTAGPVTRVDAVAPSGATTVLNVNSDGFYYAVLPPGTFTVAPVAPQGGRSEPPSQAVVAGGLTKEVDFVAFPPPPEIRSDVVQDALGLVLASINLSIPGRFDAVKVVNRVFPTINVTRPTGLNWGGVTDWSGPEGTVSWDVGSMPPGSARDLGYQMRPRAVVADQGGVIAGINTNGWTGDGWASTSQQPVTVSVGGEPLILSAKPALVPADGVLYRQPQDAPVQGAFRVAVDHGMQGSGQRNFYWVFVNNGDTEAILRQGALGLSNGRGSASAAGQEAAVHYLDGRATTLHQLVIVPPHGTVAVRIGTLAPRGGTAYLAATTDLDANQPVQVGVVAVTSSGGDPGDSFAGDPAHHEFSGKGFADAVPLDGTGTRGTFAHDSLDVTLPAYATDDAARYGWRLTPQLLQPASDTHETSPTGEGLLYRFHLATTTMYNNATAQVLLNPRGGAFKAAAQATGGRGFAVPARGALASADQAAGLGRVSGATSPGNPWTLQMMIAPGSHLPAALVVSPAFVRSTVEVTYASATQPVAHTTVLALSPPPTRNRPQPPPSIRLVVITILAPILLVLLAFGGPRARRAYLRRRRHRRIENHMERSTASGQ